jgi:ABC-type iron transport system FetAB ATPase subunit
MPSIDVVVSTQVSNSARVKQLSGMFDVPLSEKLKKEWKIDVPLDDKSWNVGLIVGPSGCGKSIVGKHLFGDLVDQNYEWKSKSVIDDFPKSKTIKEISEACSAVGFNTIPSWMKPFNVLSNGEKFRVDLARRLTESDDMIVLDEFTSVVDRQVAKIASHAMQKRIRKDKKQFVAISCHSDIIDWLQPDWVLRPEMQNFEWRCLRQRPQLEITIKRIERKNWKKFSAFHYMSQDLNKSAQCFGLFLNDELVSFAGVLSRPISSGKYKNECLWGVSRLVTLPDYQGLGLAFVLVDALGSLYKIIDKRFRTYPAHPGLIKGFAKSQNWKMIKKPGVICITSKQSKTSKCVGDSKGWGGRPNATFEYVGPSFSNKEQAFNIIKGVE